MSDTETEGRLDALAKALCEDAGDEACLSHPAGQVSEETTKGGAAKPVTEPYSGIRYTQSRVKAEALDSFLDRFTPLNHLDKLKDAVTTVSTIAIIGRRTVSTSCKGTVYIKWHLTDLKECNIVCFAFSNAAEAFSQVLPGEVVAFQRASYDGSQQGCLKINDTKQMKQVGTSADFGYCAGHNRKGERCQNVVNKSTCKFCDHHLQQGRKKLVMGARPECQGTVLGAVHGAQIRNPECLSRLSQRTPKKKKPQSLEQMKECAGQISHGRAGSMGAKLITRFVQQQRQAARSARLDKEEAALYRGPECDSAAIELPLPSIATEVIKSARTKDTMQKTSQRGNSESDPRGSKRTASTVEVSEARKLQKNGSRHMGNDYSFHRSERGNEQLPAGRGTCRGSAYVADLLQEIAADGSRGQDLKAQESLQHEVVGQAGKMRRQPRSMEGRDVVVQPQSDRLPAPDAIRKQVKTVSTERRVRQVLAEIR